MKIKANLLLAIISVSAFLYFTIVGLFQVFRISNFILDFLFFPSLFIFFISGAASTMMSQNE
ncbi:MAG: hypothetical protein JW928_01215 [Candidatus Aureabacteria bacterium]|nr:hypothetical protein [Candidatus Auribacterota bacterium]